VSILTRTPKPDPTTVYESLIGFAYAAPGAPTSIPRGARLRGDNPIVLATFSGGLWAPSGLDDAEMAAFRRELTVPPPTAPEEVPAPEPVRQMRCTKQTTIGAPLGGSVAYLRVEVGDVLPSNHVAVRRFPKNFEPVED